MTRRCPRCPDERGPTGTASRHAGWITSPPPGGPFVTGCSSRVPPSAAEGGVEQAGRVEDRQPHHPFRERHRAIVWARVGGVRDRNGIRQRCEPRSRSGQRVGEVPRSTKVPPSSSGWKSSGLADRPAPQARIGAAGAEAKARCRQTGLIIREPLAESVCARRTSAALGPVWRCGLWTDAHERVECCCER